MKIQYCSDLHLEFPENRKFLKENPLIPVADILLLAGDILPFGLNHKTHEFFDQVSKDFKVVYWIPGNHEYYNYDLKNVHFPLNEKIRYNVFLVNDLVVKIGDVHFIFTTLWSHINEQNAITIRQSVSDFFVIKNNNKNLSIDDFNEMHRTSLSFLTKALEKTKSEKQVVMTHHVPTLLNYPPHYKTSIINNAFVVELFDFISYNQPNFWIYGHHHTNTPPFQIGKTNMLTNQLGYVQQNEHHHFLRDRCFEV